MHNEIDAITTIPKNRWDIDYNITSKSTERDLATQYGAFVEDVSLFDAGFFGISRREAEYMDPQQRLLLMKSIEAFESANILPEDAQKGMTGVYIGVSSVDYDFLLPIYHTSTNLFLGTGMSSSIATGRISYFFGFKGASISIDTACSSGLVAMDLGYKNVKTEVGLHSLIGGINIIINQKNSNNFFLQECYQKMEDVKHLTKKQMDM